MKNVWTLAWKDIKLFLVDRKALMISFAVPISIATFFALVMGGNSDSNQKIERIPFLIVDNDQSAVTKAILAELKKNDTVEPIATEEALAKKQVLNGVRSVALVFEKGFGDKAKAALFAGDVPNLPVYFDPSKKTELQIVQGAFMQSAMGQISKAAFSGTGSQDSLTMWRDNVSDPKQREAIDTLIKTWPQAQGGSDSGQGNLKTPFDFKPTPMTAKSSGSQEINGARGHIFAGMAVQGVLFFAIEAAMAMLRDRRTGVWRRLRAAPVSRRSLILGRLLSATMISSFIGLGVFVFGMVVLGVRVSGSWPGFALNLLAASLMTASFGLLIASLGRTEAQARGVSILAVMMMSMLGGAWFPTFLMPKFVQTISLFIPVRWAVDGFDAVTWRGLGIESVLPTTGMLLVFTALFAGVALARFRWEE